MKAGTLIHSSQLSFQVWAIAIFLCSTNLKGVSSMNLHRDFGVTQKTAWHLAHCRPTRQPCKVLSAPGSHQVQRSTRTKQRPMRVCRNMNIKPSITLLRNSSAGKRIRTAWSRSGLCSSVAITGRSTSSAKSTWIAMPESLPDGTIFDRKIRLI